MAFDAPSVHDLGLSNRTEADGMAVATLSPLVRARMHDRLAGVCTVGDADMLRWVAAGHAHGLQFEPSATAGFAGPQHLMHGATGKAFRTAHMPHVAPENIVHVVWATGGLSSFLDNAPTYVVFFELAKTMNLPPEAATVTLGTGAIIGARLLTAVSLGAVFMGAMTYIGNGPNFMVKAIAEQSGVRMPSFFGYMFKYSIPIRGKRY